MNRIFDWKNDLLAFAHVEHTAGTTMNHILRRIFFLRFIDVSPLSPLSGGIFQQTDLNRFLSINPFLRGISGHSLKIFTEFTGNFKEVKFITILRNPLKRYVSHYIHYMDTSGQRFSFQEFLTNDVFSDFQTKSIVSSNFQRTDVANSTDLSNAIGYLREKYWLVGITERFDEFLVLLKNCINASNLDILYERKNVSKKKGEDKKLLADELLEKYYDKISERNEMDLEIFRLVEKEILPKQRHEYGLSFSKEIAEFRSVNEKRHSSKVSPYIDYFVRKAYYEPIIGSIRKLNGLSYGGRY